MPVVRGDTVPLDPITGERTICCAFDVSGEESLVTIAQTEAETLIAEYESGINVHTQSTSRVMGLKDDEEPSKEDRNHIKRLGISIPYGRTDYGISKEFNITEEEAASLRQRFLQGMPEYAAKFEQLKQRIITAS